MKMESFESLSRDPEEVRQEIAQEVGAYAETLDSSIEVIVSSKVAATDGAGGWKNEGIKGIHFTFKLGDKKWTAPFHDLDSKTASQAKASLDTFYRAVKSGDL
jgi:hypothetical protein